MANDSRFARPANGCKTQVLWKLITSSLEMCHFDGYELYHHQTKSMHIYKVGIVRNECNFFQLSICHLLSEYFNTMNILGVSFVLYI